MRFVSAVGYGLARFLSTNNDREPNYLLMAQLDFEEQQHKFTRNSGGYMIYRGLVVQYSSSIERYSAVISYNEGYTT